VDNYIGVSSYGRREMSVYRHIQGVMDPLFLLTYSNNEILCSLKQVNHFMTNYFFYSKFYCGVL